MTNLVRPRIGWIYTLEDIMTGLALRDSPSLEFKYQGKKVYIQDSHMAEPLHVSVPGFGQSTWKYEGETDEWIPCFKATDDESILQFVDVVPEIQDPALVGQLKPDWWVTPKGHPCKQYYDQTED